MLLGALALFVTSLGYGIVVPLLPEIVGGDRAADPGALSAVYAVFAAARIAAQVPGGIVVDRSGARRVLALALLVFTASLAGLLVRGGVAWFVLVRAIEGIAAGFAVPAVFSIVMTSADPTRAGRSMGIASGLGLSGLLVGPAVGALLARHGARAPVQIACAASLLVTFAAFAAAFGRGSSSPPRARSLSDEARLVGSLLSDRSFIALILPVAFNKLTYSALQGIIPVLGPASLAIGTRGVMALFGIIGVCFGVAQPIGGALADRVDPRRLVLALLPVLLASLFAMGLTRQISSFGVATAAYTLVASVIFAATLKHAGRTYGEEAQRHGGVFGVLATSTDLMTIAGPLLFLNLYAALGPAVFLAMAAAGVPFAVGFVRLGRPTPG
jgi:MFS family permease